ncbi:MAG: glycerol kinase GlpK [Bacteroidales bacterium]
MHRYILSIDQSTSATKAVLFSDKAEAVDKLSKEHSQFYPKPGWVEHNPEEIFQNTIEIIKEIINRNPGKTIIALSLTNQRETVVVWDRNTGKPVYNAVVWQCNRGASRCKKLIEEGWKEVVRKKTGLIIDPYFSATGISWILDNVQGARKKAENGELVFGTIDSWLIWNLTGGTVHATDYTNACRTMLFDINTLKWDDEIMGELGIPKSMSPEVKYADEIFGTTDANGAFTENLPITGVLGDSHAALFGQLCFEPGMGKATYGTGSSIMMNIGENPLVSPEGLVTSIGYAINGKVTYVYEGNIHCTGGTIKWLQDDLELINSDSEAEIIARQVPSAEGVYFVPAFAGLGAPYWNNEARAIICGMTRGSKKAHVVRAALEAIAYQVKDLVDLMTERSGIKLKELRVDGGPVKNNLLMQFQADMLQSTINRSEIPEASALGVALVAGLSTGVWKNMDELISLRSGGDIIKGEMAREKADQLYDGWKRAVQRSF